jgi:hypothetical protein
MMMMCVVVSSLIFGELKMTQTSQLYTVIKQSRIWIAYLSYVFFVIRRLVCSLLTLDNAQTLKQLDYVVYVHFSCLESLLRLYANKKTSLSASWSKVNIDSSKSRSD